MVCQVCKNPDGPCRVKTRECKFFMTPLPEEFRELFAVPCYVKDKIGLLYDGMNVMHAIEDVHNGEHYQFDLVKSASKICITGEEWKRFLMDFKMEAGDIVLFGMSTSGEIPLKITPMDGHCNNKVKSVNEYSVDLDEEFHQKHTVVVITRGLDFTHENRVNWEHVVTERGSGLGPLFVRKLTSTNANKYVMKIPKIIAKSLGMELNGVVGLLGNTNEKVEGYFHTLTDGRIQISDEEWEIFVKANGLLVGQRVMFLFHLYEGDLFSHKRMIVTVDQI